jgi:hypothetical protein
MTATEIIILEENKKTISRLRNVEKDGATMTELGYDHEGRVFVLRKKAAKGPLGYLPSFSPQRENARHKGRSKTISIPRPTNPQNNLSIPSRQDQERTHRTAKSR